MEKQGLIGIYCITNTINDKKYIGQSWDIEKRWKEHDHNPPNSHIKSSKDKYGIDKFVYTVIREVSESKLTQCLLDVLEEYYINLYNTCDKKYGYNKRHGGSAGRLTQETRDKISKSHIGIYPTAEVLLKQSLIRTGVKTGPCSQKRKDAISKANTGKKRTKQQCENISKAMRGRKTGPCSECRRKAISEAKKGKRPYNFKKGTDGKFVAVLPL